MKLVEPFKSAQLYYYWVGEYPSLSDPGCTHGTRVYYKRVVKGIFRKRPVLMVWHTGGCWSKSAHAEPPVEQLAMDGIAIDVDSSKKARLQLQREDAAEKRLNKSDRAWSREQNLFIAKKAIARERMCATDREKKELLDSSPVPQLLDGLLLSIRDTR